MTGTESWIDSVATTRTLVFVRSAARGVWRTAFLVLVAFVVWTGLGRGGPLETRLPHDVMTLLEARRSWLGPVLVLPALISSLATWRRMRRSPLLPGRPTLVAVTLLGLGVLGGLAPLQALRVQRGDEHLAREILLPMARDILHSGGALPAPGPGWAGHPRARAVTDPTWIAVVDLPWVSGGALGIKADGTVSPLRPPVPEMRPR